jgi:predicted RNase H-like HicB family nuclease
MTIHVEQSVIIRRDRLGDGTECFLAEDPALPGCVSYGFTPEEAAEQYEEAKEVYLRARSRWKS